MLINIYTDNPKYEMHCKEYEIIWKSEGKRIIEKSDKDDNLSRKSSILSELYSLENGPQKIKDRITV